MYYCQSNLCTTTVSFNVWQTTKDGLQEHFSTTIHDVPVCLLPPMSLSALAFARMLPHDLLYSKTTDYSISLMSTSVTNFYASANVVRQWHNVFWLFMHLSRIFSSPFSTGAIWDTDECCKFWESKSQKFEVMVGSNMLENALLALLTINAISWKLLNWISLNFQCWCTLGQKWIFGVKRSKINVTAWPTAQWAEAYKNSTLCDWVIITS